MPSARRPHAVGEAVNTKKSNAGLSMASYHAPYISTTTPRTLTMTILLFVAAISMPGGIHAQLFFHRNVGGRISVDECGEADDEEESRRLVLIERWMAFDSRYLSYVV